MIGATITASINSRPNTLTTPTKPGTLSKRCSHGGMSKSTLGSTQAGVRWYTSRFAATPDSAPVICTPLDPVPITATRLPRTS